MNLRVAFPELQHTIFILARECFDAIGYDQQGVFKLGTPSSIQGRRRPLVGPIQDLGRPFANHGFNRKRVTGGHLTIGLVVPVMQNVGVGVEGLL